MARDQKSSGTAAPAASDRASASRLPSLDSLRGLIIVVMAIDHARAFVARNHPGEFWGTRLPDYQGDWLAFLTRLVTHLCAPGFMFLMGAGAALFAASRVRADWSPIRVTGHLALRGLVLIVLGQLLENTAAAFGTAGAIRGETYGLRVPGAPGAIPVVLGVLYGLGSALAVAALLVRLPPSALVVVSGACVLATHWLTPPASQVGDPIYPLLGMLVVPGLASPVLAVYPTIPWLAPTLLGVAFGRSLEHDRDRAFRRIAFAGVAFLAIFVGLRASGGFGSFQPVEAGWIGFLNITKYPPSLTFLLFTLGANFVLLSGLELIGAAESRWLAPLRVYGSVPLFFFVTHLWLYAAMGRFFPAGTTIPRMYPFWLLGLVLLYVPCRWYGELKRRWPSSSLLRLL
jgi:uncharacterized membrane protein